MLVDCYVMLVCLLIILRSLNILLYVCAAVVFSSLCFDDSGELLASGDKRGNVVVLQHDNDKSPSSTKSAGGCNQLNYKVYRTFQSHTSEYDYQKTANVDPTIVKIRWLKRSSPSRFLLAANERSIKLWKLNEHRNEIMSNAAANFKDCMNSRDLRLPVVTAIDSPSVSATLRRMFTNGHEYGINSVSVNSDQQTFLSADDLRINVWNMEVADETYNVVDLKPPGATELTELTTIITSAEFHPDECHMFAYSTNTGLLRLCDMRQQALCDQHAKLFQNQSSESSTGVLSDIIKSISDVKFCRTSGPYLLTRDYLTLKVWDVRCDGQGPCETYAVHPYLSGRLSFLYENDCIMDRFECDWGYNDRVLSGGSYHDLVHMFDRVAKSDINLRVSSALDSPPSSSSSSSSSSNDNQHVVPLKSCQVLVSGTFRKKKDEINVEKLNYTHKMKNIAWHPSECIMAVASGSRIYGMLGKDLSL